MAAAIHRAGKVLYLVFPFAVPSVFRLSAKGACRPSVSPSLSRWGKAPRQNTPRRFSTRHKFIVAKRKKKCIFAMDKSIWIITFAIFAALRSGIFFQNIKNGLCIFIYVFGIQWANDGQIQKANKEVTFVTSSFSAWELLDSNQRPPACKADALNQLS